MATINPKTQRSPPSPHARFEVWIQRMGRDREQEGWGEGGQGCIARSDNAQWPITPAVCTNRDMKWRRESGNCCDSRIGIRMNYDHSLTLCAKAVEGYRTPRREAFSGAQMLRQVVLGAPKPREGGECASPLALFPMCDPYLAPAPSAERDVTRRQECDGRLRSFRCRRCDRKTNRKNLSSITLDLNGSGAGVRGNQRNFNKSL
jgi:hypothetical protein